MAFFKSLTGVAVIIRLSVVIKKKGEHMQDIAIKPFCKTFTTVIQAKTKHFPWIIANSLYFFYI